MNNKEQWYISIIAIIIAFICFWPIGCILLYLRWQIREGKFVALTKTLYICGIGLVLFGSTGIIASFDGGMDAGIFFIALLMFIVPGGILALIGFKRKNQIKGYKGYLNYINSRRVIKIDDLCNNLNVNYDTAMNILADMINKGMIKGYLTDNELKFKNNNENANIVVENNQEVPSKPKETKVIKCKECGAKNTLPVGETKECEYCGTLLQ